jgi:mono/diheme cytochrome c family protein
VVRIRPLRLLAAVLASAALARAPLAFGSAAAGKGNAAEGKKIFAVKCVACHKADGSGGIKLTGNPTPNWRDAKRMSDPKHDDAYLRDCMTNGKPKSGMQPVAKLGVKPAEIDHLIAFVRTLAKK